MRRTAMTLKWTAQSFELDAARNGEFRPYSPQSYDALGSIDDAARDSREMGAVCVHSVGLTPFEDFLPHVAFNGGNDCGDIIGGKTSVDLWRRTQATQDQDPNQQQKRTQR
jgi:hypothetical protein